MSGSMRELRHRIRSVGSTEQMTRAMRTVAVSKYSRVQATAQAFEPFRDACGRLLQAVGGTGDAPRPVVKRVCYVCVTANRGLCSSYNLEVIRYLTELLAKEEHDYSVILCGRWGEENAAGCGVGHIAETIPIPDTPDYGKALELTRHLRKLWTDGTADEVVLVWQRFRNILTQTPDSVRLLPFAGSEAVPAEERYLFLPDRESLLPGLREQCLTSQVYGILLSAASGAHGAMLVAMRQAADNSAEMLAALELQLNRMRQATVTTEVLELSSGAEMQNNSGSEETNNV